ncbi:hypothetical protein A3A76_01300 [Candidatus Woesebacteria bacterium RIFCSPLOWO2_01_FULL_39_23]|uniref:HTH crp-type domain-containing protein n=1 Tax=Candidatus Woesebacteria bacterium RIFCSPHIGHO2_01_FULL_40_22 TaxID=1802499 RepID=A0A1F7YGS8_9BACT|nr:MAG: hypothetical protein A2141_05070 [Candidatus Woesebacteria bacterium RBG_16_40_11]OGM26462.1 MAG: hypothetical protein A2628_02895 [Candidatus Woesebacteria bacterium RIFCSPHIGHO2_01_FULL_40_22]OGM37631.1 MAG: hypothetical protein A3E41_05410 [Candidatus Woesebacteria bacterium RIFCSPHIGHO2_12_FULL_38_9]OGM62915.1 MAG: hypothetical protein A3A76_01300 [Candidatus Woesebacteria bacterium RIFCSPLOWO2_01_FULL_39_23]
MDKDINQKLLGFFSKHVLQSYKRGEILIRAEEEPPGVFYMINGYVKMASIFENGSELTVNIFKQGAFFPMLWAIADSDNAYFYQAMTSTEVFKATRGDALKFINDNPDVLYDLTRRLLVGMDGLLSTTQQLLYGNAYKRVASAFIVSAKRFGKSFKNKNVLIDIPLTHQDIANLAGITRETASISIEKLQSKGLIFRKSQKFIVKNLTNLELEASM